METGNKIMEWVKALYGTYGAPYPAASLIVVAVIGALLFGGVWYSIGKQYDKDQEIKMKSGDGSVASVNQTGVTAGTINGNLTIQTIDNRGIFNAAPNQGSQTVNNYAPPERHITQRQFEKFIAAMPDGDGKKIGIRIQDGSNEGRKYFHEVGNLFQQAGWEVILTDGANTLSGNYHDLVIEVGDPEPEATKSIAPAFNQAKIKFHTVRGPWATGTADMWRIVIWPSE